MTEQEERLKDDVREELTELATKAYDRGYVDGQAAAERQLHEAHTQLEEAERDTTGALALVDRHRQRAESAEAQLEELREALEELISLNDEMVQRGVEASRIDAATEQARSLLTHSTPPSDG